VAKVYCVRIELQRNTLTIACFVLDCSILGSIISIEQDVRHSYHVELHDHTIMQRPIQFTDPREFTLGALSATAAAFACGKSESSTVDDGLKDVAGSLLVRIFQGWGAASRSTWSVPIPVDEEPIGLAICDSHVILVSDAAMIRIFTLGGLQIHAFTLSGRFVAVAAAKSWLMIVQHAAAPFNGTIFNS
jgi:chromosome transmission fidelity protein 4